MHPGASWPPSGDKYESFHSAYDLPEYASIFGDFNLVAYDGSAVLFREVEQKAVSGPGASFGGVVFNPSNVHTPRLKAVKDTIDGLAAVIRERCSTCSDIHLRLAPDIYYPSPLIRTLHAAFAIAGWSNVGEATHVVTKESFQPRKSTIRNAGKAEHRCTLSLLDPALCFDFLADVKLQKGYRFGYTRPRFLEQVKKFPSLFRCFGVRAAGNELLAASFELATHDWALLLHWDQTAAGRSMGATDYLLLERLEELFRTGRRFVDLGTTTDGRKANWGLIRHKENFGGHAFIRNTYVSAREHNPLMRDNPRQ